MSRTRIYQAVPLVIDERICLNASASHHLARVLRASVGEELILFNGMGGEYVAIITDINKKSVTVELKQFIASDVESPVQLYLAQGIARGEKMDFIMQKAVELGVNKIFPLITERCNVRLDAEREAKRLQHWQSIVISACEQSGRNSIPEIIPPQSLSVWFPSVEADARFVLSPHVNDKLSFQATCQSAVLLIGPEGGLSDNEVELAKTHHFQAIQLGPRILRTETATIAALAVLQCRLGDLR